jgi:hypothetical protein
LSCPGGASKVYELATLETTDYLTQTIDPVFKVIQVGRRLHCIDLVAYQFNHGMNNTFT